MGPQGTGRVAGRSHSPHSSLFRSVSESPGSLRDIAEWTSQTGCGCVSVGLSHRSGGGEGTVRLLQGKAEPPPAPWCTPGCLLRARPLILPPAPRPDTFTPSSRSSTSWRKEEGRALLGVPRPQGEADGGKGSRQRADYGPESESCLCCLLAHDTGQVTHLPCHLNSTLFKMEIITSS